MRHVLLACALLGVAVTDTPAANRFVQPRVFFVIAGPRGTDIPLQARIARSADNRWISLTWENPEGESGQWEKSLDGDLDAAVQPESPITIRVTPGRYELQLRVFGADPDHPRVHVVQELLVQ